MGKPTKKRTPAEVRSGIIDAAIKAQCGDTSGLALILSTIEHCMRRSSKGHSKKGDRQMAMIFGTVANLALIMQVQAQANTPER